MNDITALVADNINIWTGAIKRKNTTGRGSSKKINLYGIDRLRALILDLAMLGKLVQQDAGDEPASELLVHARKAQAEAIESNQMRRPKSLDEPVVPLGGVTLPNRWEWARLIDVAIINPKNSIRDDVEASFIPMPLISNGTDGAHDFETRNWGDIKKGYTHFADGDVALAKITPCFENGKAALFVGLINGVGSGTTELHVARPLIDGINRRFLLLTMKTPRFLSEGEANMTGTAGQKRVPRSYFELRAFALPPLAEQQRIVAKVDELMTLCDALERESEGAMAAHQTLVETILATLINSVDAADLAKNWARLESHFDTLFTTETSIEALKQTILDLAVRGKLLAQTDPTGWVSAPLSKIIGPMDSGWSPACLAFPAIAEETWGVLKTTAVQRLKYLPEQNKELPEKLKPRLNAECRAGDILITRAGPTNRVGICCYVSATRPRLMISDKIIRFRPASDEIDGAYLALALSVGPAAEQIEKAKSGMAASQVNISQTKLSNIEVAIPPLPEQHRIIAKVDALMAHCDQLKSHLANAAQTQRDLADAITEQVAA